MQVGKSGSEHNIALSIGLLNVVHDNIGEETTINIVHGMVLSVQERNIWKYFELVVIIHSERYVTWNALQICQYKDKVHVKEATQLLLLIYKTNTRVKYRHQSHCAAAQIGTIHGQYTTITFLFLHVSDINTQVHTWSVFCGSVCTNEVITVNLVLQRTKCTYMCLTCTLGRTKLGDV